MHCFRNILVAALLCGLLSCSRSLSGPAKADNIVVAHRGGSLEVGLPDNSIAALEYAIGLGCMASECDIYWTKDNNVIVAHSDDKFQINGLYPWEHTLAEIRAAGKLPNGEEFPSLAEYLDCLMKKSRCTELWIDIKNIYLEEVRHDIAQKACQRSCEIIREMGAEEYVKFICSSHEKLMEECEVVASQYGIEIAWMSKAPLEEYLKRGYDWCNLGFYHMASGLDSLRINAFTDAGVKFSVYTVDREELMDKYVGYADKLCGITTNYPKKLLDKLKKRHGQKSAE